MEMVRDLASSLLPSLWNSKPSLPAAAAAAAPSIHHSNSNSKRWIAQVSAIGQGISGISTGIAAALDYDDIIQGAGGSAAPIDAASAISPADGIDFSVAESVLGFVSDNPAAIAGGVLAIAVPVLVSRFVGGGAKTWGLVSAKEAYQKLAAKDAGFQILDIRDAGDIKTEGTPDLRKFKKRVLQVSFDDDEAAFVAKVKRKFKDPANTTLYILDRFDGKSLAAAKLLAANGFKEVYGIKDGAEGGRGWQQSDLPWLLPRKGLSINLDVLKEAIQFESDIVPATLGVAAAAGVGLVVFSEAETALQLVGTVALLQLFARKFLFAEDRKKTIQEIKSFLDTKVAPKELVEELQGVGRALLPKFEEVTESGNGAFVSDEQPPEQDQKPTATPSESPAAALVSAAAEEKSPESASESAEAKTPSRPSSPYNTYPDLKPPSSPTPSRP